MSEVTVDREALRAVLKALTDANLDLINELRVGMMVAESNSSVMILIRDFNASVAYQTITKGLFDESC